MIRIKLNHQELEKLELIKSYLDLNSIASAARLSYSISISEGKILDLKNSTSLGTIAKEFRDQSNLFGNIIEGLDNTPIYRTSADVLYEKQLSDEEFIKAFRLHMNNGISKIINKETTPQEFLVKQLKINLSLTKTSGLSFSKKHELKISEFKGVLEFVIGQDEIGNEHKIRLNDLNEFDNRNIAIAGMAGSGKTQLVKDLLYQFSTVSEGQLKFIFMDYKGEGNRDQLSSFLDATNCKFIDIIKDGGLKFNPLISISDNERERPFSISSFVDTIATFVPSMGVAQKSILKKVITELLDGKAELPDMNELSNALQDKYKELKKKEDTMTSALENLASGLFNCSSENNSLLVDNYYLNLPPNLSDTYRQLVVFLILRYINSFFSSTNDCQPNNNIFPVRYCVVIDEAHIYLANKNARKALEQILRLLRSKGVIIIMLSQGVEDYKTKDFDFASQVKLPICLNVQNKDYKNMEAFLGTPQSKLKLEDKISTLRGGLGIINYSETKIIKLRQWYKTQSEL